MLDEADVVAIVDAAMMDHDGEQLVIVVYLIFGVDRFTSERTALPGKWIDVGGILGLVVRAGLRTSYLRIDAEVNGPMLSSSWNDTKVSILDDARLKATVCSNRCVFIDDIQPATLATVVGRMDGSKTVRVCTLRWKQMTRGSDLSDSCLSDS